MSTSLTSDPLIERAHELVAKFPPKTGAPSLWLKPPATVGAPQESSWRFWHPLFSEHRDLLASGWEELEESASPILWKSIVLFGGKHKDENRELLSTANQHLCDDGVLHFVVPNEYGSKSYQKTLEAEGRLLEHQTGRKSRLYLLKKLPGDSSGGSFGEVQKNAEGFWSNPGLFSWSGVDRGSRVLTDVLRGQELNGPVADLGAGWGYLGTQLKSVLTLHLFENDRRGLEACRRNLPDRANVTTHWCDLCRPESLPKEVPKSFRTILSNPPFHVGRKEQSLLSHHFASVAHRLLRADGEFYLVGNTHLAYQRILPELFGSVDIVRQQDGFSVILSKNPK